MESVEMNWFVPGLKCFVHFFKPLFRLSLKYVFTVLKNCLLLWLSLCNDWQQAFLLFTTRDSLNAIIQYPYIPDKDFHSTLTPSPFSKVQQQIVEKTICHKYIPWNRDNFKFISIQVFYINAAMLTKRISCLRHLHILYIYISSIIFVFFIQTNMCITCYKSFRINAS